MPRRTRLVLAASSPPPRSPPAPPAPRPPLRDGAQGAADHSSGVSDAAQDDHKPAGTGSGRKIG